MVSARQVGKVALFASVCFAVCLRDVPVYCIPLVCLSIRLSVLFVSLSGPLFARLFFL